MYTDLAWVSTTKVQQLNNVLRNKDAVSYAKWSRIKLRRCVLTNACNLRQSSASASASVTTKRSTLWSPPTWGTSNSSRQRTSTDLWRPPVSLNLAKMSSNSSTWPDEVKGNNHNPVPNQSDWISEGEDTRSMHANKKYIHIPLVINLVILTSRLNKYPVY